MSAPNGPHLLHLHAAAEEHGRAHRAHHEHHRDQAGKVYEQERQATEEHMRRWAAGEESHPGEDE